MDGQGESKNMDVNKEAKDFWGYVSWNQQFNPNKMGSRLQKTAHFEIVMDFSPPLETAKENVLHYLANLLNSEKGSDVEFIVQGKKIRAHSFIIEGGSPVLASMFQHDMIESSNRSVIVKDVDPEVFQQLLHFLYNGDAPRIEEVKITEPLFIAADKYQVNLLKKWCSSLMLKKLDMENAVRYLILAHLHVDEKLQTDCLDFIAKKKADFYKRQDLKDLNRNYPDLFFEIAKLTSAKN